jgi:hypothetical protein
MKTNKPEQTRICENLWHKRTPLEPFEECPRCGSKAFHLETRITPLAPAVVAEIKKREAQ